MAGAGSAPEQNAQADTQKAAGKDGAGASSDHNSASHRARHAVAGAAAGVFSKTVLQPLDLIKTRLQVQDGRSALEYKGLRHAFRTILNSEGLLGLYRGLTPNLVGSGVSWGFYFYTYNIGKNYWKSRERLRLGLPATPPANKQKDVKLSTGLHLLCAAQAGTITVFLTNPIWMIKTRMQLQGREVQSSERAYRGIFDAATRIVKEEGPLALYRGVAPALLLVSNGALQFATYEELTHLFSSHLTVDHRGELPLHWSLLMGAIAKVFSSTCTFPLSVTRSRLYQRVPDELLATTESAAAVKVGPDGKPRRPDAKYANMFDVIGKIYRHEGLRGFYKGLLPHLMKTAPSSALTFFGYETVMRMWPGGDKHTHGSKKPKL